MALHGLSSSAVLEVCWFRVRRGGPLFSDADICWAPQSARHFYIGMNTFILTFKTPVGGAYCYLPLTGEESKA